MNTKYRVIYPNGYCDFDTREQAEHFADEKAHKLIALRLIQIQELKDGRPMFYWNPNWRARCMLLA
jgi:hypothetical protein